MKMMIAKSFGTCKACGNLIRKGSPINYDPRQRKAWHVECTPKEDPADGPDRFDMLYEDQCEAACGYGL